MRIHKDVAFLLILLFIMILHVVVITIMSQRRPRGTRCISSPACICREPDVLCWDQAR